MLQKIDKARLEAVLKAKETYQNTYKRKLSQVIISKEIGIGTSTVSEYLSGEKAISENFYRTFMEKFGDGKREETISSTQSPISESNNDELDLVKELVASNKMLAHANVTYAQANLKLADNMERLTEMVQQLSSHALQGTFVSSATTKAEIIEMLAKLRVADGIADSYERSAEELHKLLFESQNLTELANKKKI